MFNYNSSPLLMNVTFSSNTAGYGGGGMYNYTSSPVLTNVTFSGNSAAYGGGMYNDNSSSPLLTSVTFSGNKASGSGGGMFNYTSSPVLTNLTFSDNKANSRDGGGMFNSNSSPVLTNLTFSDNKANSYGGGMYNKVSSPILTNVTFFFNTAGSGGGMANDNDGKAKVTTVVNSIFWGNTAGDQTQSSQIFLLNDRGSGPENLTLYNCIVQGGIAQLKAQTSPLSLTTVGGGIGVSLSQGDPVNITYANVYGADKAHDPKLVALADNGGSVPTMALGDGSFAINTGVYIMQSIMPKGSDFYYSETGASSGEAWYLNTHPSLAISSTPPVSAVALPAGAPINIDLTAKDARGYARVGKPDIGAYEYGAVAP